MSRAWTALVLVGIVIVVIALLALVRGRGRRMSAGGRTARPASRPDGLAQPRRSELTPGRPPVPSPDRPAPATAQPLTDAQILAQLSELALGTVDRSTVASPAHAAVRERVLAALRKSATEQRYAPRRPHMLPRLMGAASDEEVSRRELASIIAQDPALVGSLLTIANSSYYRVTPDPVESVDRALVLLGTNGLRSLISAALMQPIFRTAGSTFPRFPQIAWEHASRSANAAVPHAVLVEKSDPFGAELLSLLIGLGSIVVFRVTLDLYGEDVRLQPDPNIVASLLESQAVSVARRIGASWELSARMLAALDEESANHTSALGRSLAFGRIVGGLAVLRLNRVIDEASAQASIPASSLAAADRERMWSRLTLRQAASAR